MSCSPSGKEITYARLLSAVAKNGSTESYVRDLIGQVLEVHGDAGVADTLEGYLPDDLKKFGAAPAKKSCGCGGCGCHAD
jgi:hypothetical protein